MFEYVVDSLDTIEDALHGVYEERDGKFHFNPDKYADFKAVGLKTNAAKLKTEKDKLKTEYDNFKKKYADITDEDLPTFLEWKERRALSGDDPDDKKAVEGMAAKYQQQLKGEREKWETNKKTEVSAVETERDTWKGKYRTEKLSNQLSQYAVKAGVFADEIENFIDLVLLKGHFDLSEDDDVIFMQEGAPSAITAEKAINEILRERYKRFYEAPAQGGSGSTGAGKRRSTGVDYSKMSATQRMEAARKAGITK